MATTPPAASRVLPASIFIVLGLICLYLMDIISLALYFPSPAVKGIFEWDGGSLPLLNEFHWLRPLDPIIREVTTGFAPSSLGYDDVSRWQMSNFLIADPGVFYVIWGCESLRRGIKGGPVSYPGLFALIAQFGGGGFVVPIYYFCYLVFSPPVRSLPLAERKIDFNGAAVWAVLVVVFHVVPSAGIMVDPTLEARHWWTWFWQLYSVRITMSWYILKALSMAIPVPKMRSTMSYRMKTTLVMTPFIAIGVGIWAYTVLYCPYSLSTVFYPHPLPVDTWVARMRRVLQFDQIFIWTSSVLWVAMDMRRNRVSSGIEIVLAGVVLSGLVGSGASFGLLWLWREWRLAGGEEKSGSKDE